MLGGLNNDFVLWISLGAVALSFLAVVGWGWKTFRGMEGMEHDDVK
jgi:hypothetical protein